MAQVFDHAALKLNKQKPLIFTAISKQNFYMRAHISKYVLESGGVPLNPFMSFDYFMLDTLPRDVVREANNNLVARADELWVFGGVSNGVLAEVKQAKSAGKPIKYFNIMDSKSFTPSSAQEIEMEDEVKQFRDHL